MNWLFLNFQRLSFQTFFIFFKQLKIKNIREEISGARKLEQYHAKQKFKAHRLIRYFRVIILDKLISTEIFSTLIAKVENKLSSIIYFKNLLNNDNIAGTVIPFANRSCYV